ncbi:unnamed protein product [Amoebophrya sp. A25]|nr:unnamed protein product [Amoebophrya sp. A25]|eukprot:GSA25T00001461001.1
MEVHPKDQYNPPSSLFVLQQLVEPNRRVSKEKLPRKTLRCLSFLNPYKMEESLFNVKAGFAEGILRGLKCGFLTMDDYRKLGACESLEDVRTALDDTDYSGFLQDEPSPLEISTIIAKAKQKLADEFNYIKYQATDPQLVEFMTFVQKEKMIDNVVNLLQGALNGKPAVELLAKADPLGYFEEMRTIPSLDLTQGYEDLYQTILIDTPVGPYFEEVLKTLSEDGKPLGRDSDVGSILTEQDLELLKNLLKKAWLEEFYQFIVSVGGMTSEIMGHILRSEADFRVLNITLNSLNTSLGSQQKIADRNSLYPNFGYLYPEGTEKLCKSWNQTTVRAALEPYNQYRDLYDSVKMYYDKEARAAMAAAGGGAGGRKTANIKSMEDMLFSETAKLYELSFDQQFHYGTFYAYAKLKEQEVRNLGWICNMIVMGKREYADDIIPIFAPRV